MKFNSTGTDRLVSDIKTVVNDAEGVLKELAEQTGDKAAAVRARLNVAVQNARQTCDRLQEKAKEGIETADETIREHPYQSIGVALGVGLLLGFLIGRK
jgi:ElaB/YqjD/DUF883 family membrane-anchored ribosome-binding protein